MEKRDFSKERIISIDFDGVLSQYNGYIGPKHTGKPIKGSKEFILRLIKSGYKPIVFTTREKSVIENWLERHKFPNLEVTNIKFPSMVYIDDRCIKFEGDYSKLFKDMKDFDVYWRKKKNKIFDGLE